MASSSTYGNDIVGRRVEVLWERDSNASNTNAVDNSGVGWYRGIVAAYDVSRQEHLVEYDDGDKDWYDLGKVQFRLLLETAVETVPSQTNSASNQTPSSGTLNGDSTLDSTLGGNSTIHVEADDTQHEISMDEDAAIGHNSRILSPTTKVNEALKHTKSIEESSIANASGIYEELEQTAIVLKQKSAEIQQKQHEQSRQIYRAQVMLSDEATSIANDVERRIRTEALELHKKFTTIAKRMQRDKKTLKKYQRDTERYKKDILRGDGERQNLEKRNLVLRDKIKELENTIENLRKRLKINEWKSSKAMKKIKEERETQKSQQLALMKKKQNARKRLERNLFEGNSSNQNSDNGSAVTKITRADPLSNREASILQLLFSLVGKARPERDEYGIKVFSGIAATLDVLDVHNDSTIRLLLEFCWKCAQSYIHDSGNNQNRTPISSDPGSQHLIQAMLGHTNNMAKPNRVRNKQRRKGALAKAVTKLTQVPSFLRDTSVCKPGICPLLSDEADLVVLSSCLLLTLCKRTEYIGAALEALADVVKTDAGRQEFVKRHGMQVLMPVLTSPLVKRVGHSRILQSSVALLLAIVQEGSHLDKLKRSCANEIFFRHCQESLTLEAGRNAHDFIAKIPDLEIIEALSMLLEKMSRHSGYHKYFHAASLPAKLNEWVIVLEHSTDDDANFFVMNVNAILKRLKRKKKRSEGKKLSSSRIKLRKNKIQSSNTSTKINVETGDPAADLETAADLEIEKKEELSVIDKISSDADEKPVAATSPVLEKERNVTVPPTIENIPTKETNMFGNEETSEEESLLEYYNNLIEKAKELQKNSVDDE